jgi:hypothetical protein
VKFDQPEISLAMPVGCFEVSHHATRPYRVAVDPEIKRQLDRTISEARQALEGINGDADTLAEEERTIRKEETQYKTTFVRCSPSTSDITSLNSFEESP